ncbi:MAG: M1 family aminopeptidase [Thermincolia bacterium]
MDNMCAEGKRRLAARKRFMGFVVALTVVVLAVAGVWYLNTDDGKEAIAPVVTDKEKPVEKIQPAEKEIPALPQYYLKAALDDRNYLIRGELELTAPNPGTDKLWFYAYPPWSPIKIKEVKLNEKKVQHSYEGKNLTFANEAGQREIKVKILFETPVPRAGTRFGVKDNTWLLTTWYPMLGVLDKNKQWVKRPDPRGMGDPFYFGFADYTVEWTSPANIKWVTSGALQSEKDATVANSAYGVKNKPLKTTVWKVKQVHNFALVGSPNYTIKRFKLNDKTTVSVALTETAKMEEVMAIAKSTYPLFTRLYGELPYTEVAIAETSYKTNYALEYPNLAIYSKDMYRNDKIQHWITHEVGHTWWYNAVGVHETVYGWLDEGMVEHGVVWYLENRFSKERANQLWNQFRDEHKKLNAQYPKRTMDVELHGFKDFREFDYSWYSRSADMFLTFRQALGDEKYIKFLNALYAGNVGKVADEESLDKALADSLGLKTDFFKRWLHEPYSQTSWTVKFDKINSEGETGQP